MDKTVCAQHLQRHHLVFNLAFLSQPGPEGQGEQAGENPFLKHTNIIQTPFAKPRIILPRRQFKVQRSKFIRKNHSKQIVAQAIATWQK
jgi:hypothetical protein